MIIYCVTSILGPVSYEVTLEDGKATKTEGSSDHDSNFDFDIPHETSDSTTPLSHTTGGITKQSQ